MREVVSLVFGIREAKLTIAKDKGGKVDFFLWLNILSPVHGHEPNHPIVSSLPIKKNRELSFLFFKKCSFKKK